MADAASSLVPRPRVRSLTGSLRGPVLLLVLAALLPLVILAGVFGAIALQQQQAAIERDALARADRIAGLTDRELKAQIDILRTFAQSTELDTPLDEAAFIARARRLQEAQPLWFSIRLSDPAGNRLIDVPELSSRRVVEEASHFRVVRTGFPVIGSVVRGPQRTAFAIRVPAIRNGDVVYVVSAVMQPNAMREVLLAEGLPDGWIAGLVDNEGRIAARSTGPEEFVGSMAAATVRAARTAAQSGFHNGETLEGTPAVIAYRVIPELNWSVHVAIPRQEFYAPVNNSIWLLCSAAIVTLVLVGLFLSLLLREMRIRRTAEEILESGRRMESLGRMTGGVAHDFNNLLQIMQGTAELLKRRRGEPEKIDAYSETILNATKQGDALTRQLLAFAGRSAQEPIGFRLQDRVNDLIVLLKRIAREGIVTRVSIPDDIWPVFADPNALEMALVSLAMNSREAMPNGGLLEIRAENVTLSERERGIGLTGDFVALCVTDSGRGIAAEHRPHVFEPFYTTKRAGKGVGLGLSQVYGFAKQSGGAVTLDSEVGAGTTVILYLPRPAHVDEPVRETEEHLAAVDSGRILLVEDNDKVGQVTEAMLEAAGYAVVRVLSGAAAIERVTRGDRFDVVLSDVVMEGMSGLELASQLRERYPKVPIVLMTGFSKALLDGSSNGLTVLSKPFRLADVVAALKTARLNQGNPMSAGQRVS